MSKYYLDATNKGSGRTPAYHAGEWKKQRDGIAAHRKQKRRHMNMPRRNAIDGSESRVGIASRRNGRIYPAAEVTFIICFHLEVAVRQ